MTGDDLPEVSASEDQEGDSFAVVDMEALKMHRAQVMCKLKSSKRAYPDCALRETKQPLSYAKELLVMVRKAKKGDIEAGEILLRLFAKTRGKNAHPVLVRHVARCIGRILDDDVEPREALCIKRPANRRADTGKIAARHDAALHAYCRARGQGQTHVQASDTAVREVAGLTEGVMKHVYEDAGNKFKRDLLVKLYTHEVRT